MVLHNPDVDIKIIKYYLLKTRLVCEDDLLN